MNGNITQDGIDKDLAWMKRIGLGGVQNFDAAFNEPAGPFNTPLIVDKRLVFMTPEWRAAFKHAVETADADGFEFAIAGSPGWSETGGPWVKPEQAMKKLVWSETPVDGGRKLAKPLVAPPIGHRTVPGPARRRLGHGSREGRYADLLSRRGRGGLSRPGGRGGAGRQGDGHRQQRHRHGGAGRRRPDAPGRTAVRARQGDLGPVRLRPSPDPSRPAPGRGPRRRVRRVRGHRSGGAHRGQRRRQDLPDPGRPAGARRAQQTVAFAATTARYFRVVFLPRKPDPASAMFGIPTPTAHKISELAFEAGARVQRFEDKAGWSSAMGLNEEATPEAPPTR
jgi:hypothetical protein